MLNYATDKRLLHPKEVAYQLDCSVWTIRRAIHAGSLEAVRLGGRGRFRIRPEAVERFLEPAVTPEEGAAP